MAVVVAGLGLGGPLGCKASSSEYDAGRPLEGDDVPRCFRQAHKLEQHGVDALGAGNDAQDLRVRREKYDVALDYYRQAVTLYEDELASDPGSPEKQRALQREIHRLDDTIRQTHKDRPQG